MHTHLRNCRLFSNFVTSFTFLLKCVTIVNADCQLPPTYDNAEYQILPNTTSETTAVYNCKLGFYMSGQADFVVLVCGQENEWIGPDVDCTNKLACPNPPYPAYGSFYATSNDLTYESNITYTCNEGYTLEGPRHTQCSLTGEWVYNDDVVDVPLCKRTCSQEDFRYHNHECYERRQDSSDWVTSRSKCEEGGGLLATIKDQNRQTFIENLLSSENQPYWIGGLELQRDWKYPSDGKYANYFNWATGEPSYDYENCVYLSNLHGVENAHEWNDESCNRDIIDTTPPMQIFAVCEAEGHCSDLSTSFKNFPYEGKCIIFLDDSQRNQSSAKTKCWNDFGGILVEIRNDALQMLIENFIDTNISIIANWWIGLEEELIARTWSWVDGERIENYFWGNGEPNGNFENCIDVLQNLNYRWNDNNCGFDSNYICQYGESKCGNPGVPLHGNISVYQEAYAIGDSVLFSCDVGYVLSDHSLERISCQNDTTWNQPIPSCEKINCSESVPVVQNAMYYIPTNSTSYRDVVVYQCNTNYLLTGYPASECQEDGTWSDPNVTCTGVEMTTKLEYLTTVNLNTIQTDEGDILTPEQDVTTSESSPSSTSESPSQTDAVTTASLTSLATDTHSVTMTTSSRPSAETFSSSNRSTFHMLSTLHTSSLSRTSGGMSTSLNLSTAKHGQSTTPQVSSTAGSSPSMTTHDHLTSGVSSTDALSTHRLSSTDSLKITTSSTKQMMTSPSDEIIDGTTTLRSGSSTIRQSTTNSVTSLTPIKVTATSLQITEHKTSRKVTEPVSKETVTESEEPNAALIVGVSVSSAVIVIVVAVVIVVLYLERTEQASGFDLETNEDNGFMHPNPAYEDLATINSREPNKPAENIYQANDDKPIIYY